MKKLLVLLVLLFVTSIYSQSPFELGRNGTVWNDSLWCGETVVGDSVYFVDLNFDYEDALIFLQGNANDTVDSVNITGIGSTSYKLPSRAEKILNRYKPLGGFV